jgi:myo-inositol 2-dehydrogenase/D-chiro-inositol 1-dehydrogenase
MDDGFPSRAVAMKNVGTPKDAGIGRRQLVGAGAAAASVTLLRPETVRGFAANEKVRLAIWGCGDRGQWLGKLFAGHGGFHIAACQDYFESRTVDMNNTMVIVKHPEIPPEMRFTGLSGYKRLLDKAKGAIDAVALVNPPFFRPAQAAAAVEAGLHVWCAKPVGVDVPGCLSITESGIKASEKKRAFLVDFQYRSNPADQEAVKLVQEGAIGKIVCGEANFITGDPFGRYVDALRKNPKDPEVRLRGWGLDAILSGDIIVEQNVHQIDVATWVLDAAPVAAIGRGRTALRGAGDCYDDYHVIFQFPNEVYVSLDAKQFDGGGGFFCRLYGSDGMYESHYSSHVAIEGKTKFRKNADIGESGTCKNIATFQDIVINATDFSNTSAEYGARSTLAAVLGRDAARSKKELTWDEMMKKAEKLDPGLQGLKE